MFVIVIVHVITIEAITNGAIMMAPGALEKNCHCHVTSDEALSPMGSIYLHITPYTNEQN